MPGAGWEGSWPDGVSATSTCLDVVLLSFVGEEQFI